MSEQNFQNDGEIDLSELLQLFTIAFITGISIFLSGFYALTTEKQYTANSVFNIEQSNSKGLSLGGELGALAAIAGFSASVGSGTDLLLERIKSREFILEANQKLALSDDTFFNTYNPNAKTQLGKRLSKH